MVKRRRRRIERERDGHRSGQPPAGNRDRTAVAAHAGRRDIHRDGHGAVIGPARRTDCQPTERFGDTPRPVGSDGERLTGRIGRSLCARERQTAWAYR